MADVPHNFHRPLKPVNWPQDTLAIPNGYGMMPATDTVNQFGVKREFFSYSVEFPTFNSVDAYFRTQIMEIQKDADFWITSIAGGIYSDSEGWNPYVSMELTIRDVLNAYPFYTPFIPFDMTWNIPSDFAVAADQLQSITIGNIIEPYCVMRGGALEVTLNKTASPDNDEGNTTPVLTFHGWKEYANAAN